ncbi:MAG: radical SAM protein [Chloroflexi bacterium]|nr:radical SAM protein [Chloroflexota bacterium]
MGLALFHTLDQALRQKNLSPEMTRGIINVVVPVLFGPGQLSIQQRFKDKYGCNPPWFVTVSPGKACNLNCVGCYANSGPSPAKLPWPIFDRIIEEAKELWGCRFIVISGGEPLAYRSDGKGVLDAVEKHSDCMFLMYTNGTLIDKEMAARMARAGTLTPAISVEGLRERTDERRGAGVFDRILEAMANLREAGVPFGISITATRFNCEEILSDEFLDFFFGEQGAFYGFIFHYMPIGRSYTLDLMPTPGQRVELWRRTWEVIEKRQIVLIDFWNEGPLVQGCISAGREGGYIYIDWNGKVMPCVFAPYSVANIHDVYARGGTLNDLWEAPFFQAIRQWQYNYGYGREEPLREGNWLRTCPIRDHYRMYRELIDRYGPEPEDEAAQEALEDEEYYKGLVAYGVDFGEFSQEIWEKEYLGRT